MEEPLVSIVTIAKTEAEVENWKSNLKNQNYQNYEVVYSTLDSIPEAWNEAISQASGDILLFTETDTTPISEQWIETIVSDRETKSGEVTYYGEFRGYGSFNFANLTMDPELANSFKIDNTFTVGEDSEWFARMEKNDVEFEHKPIAPVYHEPRPIEREIDRSFSYGLSIARCIYRHGRLGPSTNTEHAVVDQNTDGNQWVRFFVDRGIYVLKSIYTRILFWFGLFMGFLIYLPEYIKNK